VDDTGARDRDRPDVEGRVAQHRRDRRDVAQVQIGVDDHGDPIGRRFTGEQRRRAVRARATGPQGSDDERHERDTPDGEGP
jgi:hypothetical protein